MSTNYLEELNDGQRAAVLYNEGPSLVIAGAGSGKTRVLTYKIAYLLDQGYTPWSILALTFTNKAAREMKERISQFVGSQSYGLWMGTFHSIFSRILRTESSAIGFTHNFTIYDTSDSKSLLKSIIKEMGLDDKVYKTNVVQSHISRAKNHLLLPAAYGSNKEIRKADEIAKIPATYDIYRRYWERCRQADAMDFDDLLVYTHILLSEHPEICHKYSENFKYVLVDEYQDTNFAQHSIVWLLTREHQRVCVVGDDAQSIYSFRGANIDNILKFTKQYQDARLFKLEQNYRSTQTIVQAANSLIAKNNEQIRKEVYSENTKGEPIGVFCAYSDIEEGEIVANKITDLHRRKDIAYSNIAILYRTNAQSRIFEESLRKRSIPCRIYGGLSFYQRKEIKDIIAYFRLTINPNDEEAFKRIINYPTRGIGSTTVKKIIDAATLAHVSLWEVINTPLDYGLTINKGTHSKLQGFKELISDFISEATTRTAYDLGQDIVRRSGIMNDILQDRTPEGLSRQENLEELINGIHDFCATKEEEGSTHFYLADFLSEISLLTDQDSDNNTDDNEKVTLMTIHASKGLEFRAVFIVGMEENLFPSPMSQNSHKQLEEERRLFYVALTRSEEYCFLSLARCRFRFGKTEFCNPSRFLQDIDSCYLNMPDNIDQSNKSSPQRSFASMNNSDRYSEDASKAPWERRASATKSTFRDEEYSSNSGREEERYSRYSSNEYNSFKTSSIPSKPQPIKPFIPQGMKRVSRSQKTQVQEVKTNSPSNSATNIQAGQVIEHERFGIGDILKVEGVGENCKATVRFRNVGDKQLLLKFARFKIIG